MSELINKILERGRNGGILYLIGNMVGYPVRSIRNRKIKKQRDNLYKSVMEREIPSDICLNLKEDVRVVVSVTSYPDRFPALAFCIKSLLLQSELPDRIIVYLGSDTKPSDITPELKKYEKYGVEYRIDPDRDLKPHKKYFYAMQEYPEALVITVDDDLVYPDDMVKDLLNAHEAHEDVICARRVHKMAFYRDGRVKPYLLWKKEVSNCRQASKKLLATGGGGVLYPPHSISNKAFDSDAIESLCLGADDIWLKCMEIIQGTNVMYVPSLVVYAVIPDTQKKALKNENTMGRNLNDIYFEAVKKAYNLTDGMFRDGRK